MTPKWCTHRQVGGSFPTKATKIADSLLQGVWWPRTFRRRTTHTMLSGWDASCTRPRWHRLSNWWVGSPVPDSEIVFEVSPREAGASYSSKSLRVCAWDQAASASNSLLIYLHKRQRRCTCDFANNRVSGLDTHWPSAEVSLPSVPLVWTAVMSFYPTPFWCVVEAFSSAG